MDILYYSKTAEDPESWMNGIRKRLPEAVVRQWVPGDDAHADYILAWMPPADMLKGRHTLKAVFSLGAGVDSILAAFRNNPGMMPENVPLFRLEDVGMGIQMREYAVHYVLRWFRRFDEYAAQKTDRTWKCLPVPRRESFTVGILGAGVLGLAVADSLKPWGFPLRCWSRGPKQVEGVTSFHGNDQLDAFLSGTQALINLLPNTPRLTGIINASLLGRLNEGAFVLNIARGAQLVEDDLLAALDSGQVRAAALDVFTVEPLPENHPFWTHPRVSITPHVAAETVPDDSFEYIAAAIRMLERGETPGGLVDRERGY